MFTKEELSSLLSIQEKSQPALIYESSSTFTTEFRNLYELSGVDDKMDNPLFMAVPKDSLPSNITNPELRCDFYFQQIVHRSSYRNQQISKLIPDKYLLLIPPVTHDQLMKQSQISEEEFNKQHLFPPSEQNNELNDPSTILIPLWFAS